VSEGRDGAIVFVSSLHDSFVRTRPHYSASKAAVAMLVKELAHELAPHGIRVNAVSPGVVRSAHNHFATPEQEASASEQVPLGRIGEPADVARVVAMLLSSEWSGYVTGVNIPVDGGLAVHSWSAGKGPANTDGFLLQGARRLRRTWRQS
jgi:3-oxoacyl-[acyl-carrier protein] reductase